jgi:CelD/BcsL family acetyltransferase involved in cellulose biosynthesis
MSLARPDRSGGYDLAHARLDGGLEEEWAALADRVAAPASLHPGYLRAWAEGHSQTGRLIAVTARRDGELAAVLPLVRSRSGLSARARRYVDEVGVVADGPESAAAAMTGALSLPVAQLVLRPVPEGGPTHRALAAAASQAGHPLMVRAVETQSFIDFVGDWDDYWASRSHKMRRDYGKRRRRLENLGEVRVDAYEPAALDAALDDAFRIEASGWKGREGTAIVNRPEEERFQRLLARWADSRGWFRLWFLRLDGRPIAFRLGIEAFGTYSSLKIGYLEEFTAHSPGNLLEASVMELLFRSDCRRFEYAGETQERMRRWATGTRELLELTAFPVSLRGRAGRVAAGLRARAVPVAKRARDRLRALRPRA